MTHFLSALPALFVFDGFILPWMKQCVKYTCGIPEYPDCVKKNRRKFRRFWIKFTLSMFPYKVHNYISMP